MMRTLHSLLKLIKEKKDFLIVSHINPEGDAIGSCIALALGLKKKGKSVYILNKDTVPDILKFLPYSNLISQKIPSQEFDVMFIIDCSSMERTGLKGLRAKTTVIIDHHLPQNSKLAPESSSGSGQNAELKWIEPDASATGELIYKLLNFLQIPIDKEIATNLYTAICTDTGGFRYPNTNSEILKISSSLVASGADPWKIAKEIYENFSFNRLKLLALSLATLEKKGKISWITITRKMFKETKTSIQDTENFVDFPRKIKGVEVAMLFREDRKNLYKLSFRSKGNINVADIAKTFGGGGHANAAGCELKGSLEWVKEKVFQEVKKAIKKLNSKFQAPITK